MPVVVHVFLGCFHSLFAIVCACSHIAVRYDRMLAREARYQNPAAIAESPKESNAAMYHAYCYFGIPARR